MFRKVTTFSLLLLGVLTIGWVALLVHVNARDVAAIRNKIKEQKENSSKNLFTTTHQERSDVVKEIWFTQEDASRLHYQIASKTSLLTIAPTGPKGNKFDLIEKLEDIKCWMQDKLYSATETSGPMQQVRFFQADEGLYRFASQEFLAQSVSLSLYRLNGQELPHTTDSLRPFLQGIAQDVSFAVSGKTPQFTAQHFKAELNTSGEKK